MSHYNTIETAWSESFGMKKTLWHHPNLRRERTHEVSIDNMAYEDSLLSVIWDLLKIWSAPVSWNSFQRWQQ